MLLINISLSSIQHYSLIIQLYLGSLCFGSKLVKLDFLSQIRENLVISSLKLPIFGLLVQKGRALPPLPSVRALSTPS